MTIIDTKISWGYYDLIKIFAEANKLDLNLDRHTWLIDETGILKREYIRISYKDNSDTALSITCLAVKHLGIENMFCDYLIRCGIDPSMIPIGKYVMKRPENEMELEWQKHKKTIGLNN